MYRTIWYYFRNMGFSIKEAIALYMKSGQQSDMAVKVDESPDILGVGRRDGKIVPILKPGSMLTAEEIMQKAGIRPERKTTRGRVNILGNMPISLLPSRFKKVPGKIH